MFFPHQTILCINRLTGTSIIILHVSMFSLMNKTVITCFPPTPHPSPLFMHETYSTPRLASPVQSLPLPFMTVLFISESNIINTPYTVDILQAKCGPVQEW